MTTIAYRDGIIAADTSIYTHGGDVRMPGLGMKIWRLRNGGLMGHAGVRRHADIFRSWLDNGAVGEPPECMAKDDTVVFVVDIDGRLTVYDGPSHIEVEAEFYAIGSGVAAALGAMYQGASAADAVRIASLVDPYTGGDIITLEL